jgi:hypothetical protein
MPFNNNRLRSLQLYCAASESSNLSCLETFFTKSSNKVRCKNHNKRGKEELQVDQPRDSLLSTHICKNLKQQKRKCLRLKFLVVVAPAEMIKAKKMTQNWDRRAGEKSFRL